MRVRARVHDSGELCFGVADWFQTEIVRTNRVVTGDWRQFISQTVTAVGSRFQVRRNVYVRSGT